MIPVSNDYEMGYLARDHMREGLREVERDRLARTVTRSTRQRGLWVISSVPRLLASLFVPLGH